MEERGSLFQGRHRKGQRRPDLGGRLRHGDKEFRVRVENISKTGKVLSEAERIRVAAEFLEKRQEFEEEKK